MATGRQGYGRDGVDAFDQDGQSTVHEPNGSADAQHGSMELQHRDAL